MGKLDKDRFQKELAVRFCLARRVIPFLEVVVPSAADTSDVVEVLTDIDVLGVGQRGDGGLYRTLFDCKSSSKMSPINRAFWAAGLRDYVRADDAFVILANRATRNHKLSALTFGVDLHDDQSFEALGKTYDTAFPHHEAYQSGIDRWQALEDVYASNKWANALCELCKSEIPLSRDPANSFRKVVAALRGAKGYFDPAKTNHMAILYDVLAATFVAWTTIARDMRRSFDIKMKREEFETALRYYLWGGRESYSLRQQLSRRGGDGPMIPLEMPAWKHLVQFAGVTLDSPQSTLECAHVCKEIALRLATAPDITLDAILGDRLSQNDRVVQFSAGMSGYLVAASGLPSDTLKEAEHLLFRF